jgi:hypothetical protein
MMSAMTATTKIRRKIYFWFSHHMRFFNLRAAVWNRLDCRQHGV